MDVGFIGIGNVGTPMAHNRLKAGHRLAVHDAPPDRGSEGS